MSTTDELPPELVLAAIERAKLHHSKDDPSVFAGIVFEHLNIPRRGRSARQLRSRLEDLREAGLVEETQLRGYQTWSLTQSGKERLDAARGDVQLPESPQHRKWRLAREESEREIAGFRRDVRRLLKVVLGLLAAKSVRSDEWFEIADHLGRACWTVASAIYCREEWPEPTDEKPDRDEHREPTDSALDASQQDRVRVRRMGRRDINRWRTRPDTGH